MISPLSSSAGKGRDGPVASRSAGVDRSASRVIPPPDDLAPFNDAGLLLPADIHVARRLMALADEHDPMVALAVALAVRAPRASHIAIELSGPAGAAPGLEDDVDLEGLEWPDPDRWADAIRSSALIRCGPPPAAVTRPLVLDHGLLYLDRYWRDEVLVAESILAAIAAPTAADEHRESRLTRLFPGPRSADQLAAARVALSRRFCVVAGGPGTGKTTAVARMLAAMAEPVAEAGGRLPLVALAAPTGKAAARMEEAVRAEAAAMDTTGPVRAWLEGLSGSTLHRLLGHRFGRSGRFRHDASHRLPHDVVVVDEASMVSLAMMARLIEAVAPAATLILVGDPEQLVSVDAGAVLADIVGPAGGEAGPAGGEAGPAGDWPPATRPPIAGAIAVLHRNHRFSGALAELADAIRSGHPDRALAVLSSGDPAVSWSPTDDPEDLLSPAPPPDLAGVRQRVTQWGRDVAAAAEAGDSDLAIARLRTQRLLCAHRRGPAGVAIFNPAVEQWIAAHDPSESWYPGRPVLVTANDYSLDLYNGDGGVVVTAPDGRLMVAFDQGLSRPCRLISPTRLASVETVFAMTVHKSQGSEFDQITLVLPPAGSRLLTRELLYTAVTRARSGVCVVGGEGALADAIRTPVSRASGLGSRLWRTAGDGAA